MGEYKYDHTYSDEKAEEFKSAYAIAFADSELVKRYSFTVEDGFKMPPVLDCSKMYGIAMNNDQSEAADIHRDKIVHQCLIGKTVKIYLDDVQVGSFLLSNIDDIWDAFNVITEHPQAFELIKNDAHWFVVGKYTPSLKAGAGQAVAEKATKK